MRTVALEEHFTVPSLVGRISADAISRRGFGKRTAVPGRVNPLDLLPEIGAARLKSMDASGISVQVLSTSGPGADLVDGAEGIAIAREMLERVRPLVQGVQVSAPFGKVELALQVFADSL